MSTVAVSSPRPVLADVVSKSLLSDAILVVGGAAFVGLLAQISFMIHPFVVPFTGQTLGVLLVGSTLGMRRALASMALYAVAGLAGLPWLAAPVKSGYSPLLFGYLLGFVLSVTLMSWLASKGNDRNVVSAVGLFIIGELAIYAIGVPWLAVDLHVSLAKAITLGMTPYLIFDLAKAVIAGVLLPTTWRLVDRTTKS
ncbi:MAG TPA: biotin transporter BioY [Acidimicrobiales bacterium]|jgi:biotin transport system substrate-specific component